MCLLSLKNIHPAIVTLLVATISQYSPPSVRKTGCASSWSSCYLGLHPNPTLSLRTGMSGIENYSLGLIRNWNTFCMFVYCHFDLCLMLHMGLFNYDQDKYKMMWKFSIIQGYNTKTVRININKKTRQSQLNIPFIKQKLNSLSF